jgi:hypothetical protein
MTLVGLIARHGKDEKSIQNFVGKHESKNHLGDLGVDGRITLEWITEKDGKV